MNGITSEHLYQLAGFIGIILGFLEYFRRGIEAKLHVITGIKGQIKVIAKWAQEGKPGFEGDPSDGEKFSFADPRYGVFLPEDSQLTSILGLSGITQFSSSFLQDLAEFDQLVSNLKQHSVFRNSLVLANTAECSQILAVWCEVKSSGGAYEVFEERINNESENVKYVAGGLYGLNKQIHYHIIGSAANGGLKFYHKKLEEHLDAALTRLKKSPLRDVMFILVATLTVWTTGMAFNIDFHQISWLLNLFMVVLLIFIAYKQYLATLGRI